MALNFSLGFKAHIIKLWTKTSSERWETYKLLKEKAILHISITFKKKTGIYRALPLILHAILQV